MKENIYTNQKHFLAAMYLRLSRDDSDVGEVTGRDGTVKAESNSIGSQRDIIRAFIHEQQDIELYDIYVDDGFSGSNFDRPEFKRMMEDIEAGRVNCVIVKDLSRFGRDYIESGRYIQKVFPTLHVRFIALTDHYDSFHADEGESGIILPVKNFINDSYCRDISTKVKSQFEVKRKNGEYISPFAPYGYRKAENNRNKLEKDEYAAEVVKSIFEWRIDGLAIAAIAERLNGLGILSPREYKKSIGLNFKGGFSGAAKSLWSSATVKRILNNEIYLGHMVQGKTEKINYKLKRSIEKPKEKWIKVENTHEAIISEDTFQIVQNLMKADGRISPTTDKESFFMGILFCGDCGEQMIRRINRYKDTKRYYYICSTKNRSEGCTRHSIEEEKLKSIVAEAVKSFATFFLEEKKNFEKYLDTEINFEMIAKFNSEIIRLKQEQEKYDSLCSGLYEDLKAGIVTEEEFERLKKEFGRKAAASAEARAKQEAVIKGLLTKSIISAERLKTMENCIGITELDRHTLCSMVKRIRIYENRRIEIEFYFMDHYRIMSEANRVRKDKQEKMHHAERSA
ncbi:MAG: recombinase family protein [Roseburia sp.]|nr:recombinase family protein [Roseburia sp.]